jgi:glycosyltransferase involved in cell wall biosynthesis
MKVAIDARMLNVLDDKAGLYQYTTNLIANLLKIDPRSSYKILYGFRRPVQIPSANALRIPGRLCHFWLDKLHMQVEWLVGKVDVFHGPCFYLPQCRTARTVVTIHDLMVFRHPEFLLRDWAETNQKQIVASVKSADAIIAVSEFTKRELIELFGISPQRIKVIANGVSDRFHIEHAAVGTEEIKRKYEITKPYVLFVGNIEPKKNISSLIRAFVLLRERFKYPHQLVIVGKKAWGFPSVRNLVLDLGAKKEVLFLGVVSDDDVRSLYHGADLFVFPSLFEGFGIPVIEAMACGTPVVASGHTSLAEVVDTAAVLVDPSDIEDLVDKMHAVLGNEELRHTLIQRGLARAKLFSWKETARQTLKLYHELL